MATSSTALGGNRNPATSVEPAAARRQAYAGTCSTDDLQPHSDPYYSQRSQQEMTTYVATPPGSTTNTQPINEA